MEGGDYDTVITVTDALVRLDAERYGRLSVTRFQAILLGKGQPDRAYAYAREVLADRLRDDPVGLDALATAILDAPAEARRNLDLALQIATRAVELTSGEDPVLLDTLAQAHFELGGIDEAVRIETEALKLAAPGKMADTITQTLAKYQAAKGR